MQRLLKVTIFFCWIHLVSPTKILIFSLFLNLHIIPLRQSLNFFVIFFICWSFDEEFYHDEDSVYFIYNQTFCSNRKYWFYPFLPFFSALHILRFDFLWISWFKRKQSLLQRCWEVMPRESHIFLLKNHKF